MSRNNIDIKENASKEADAVDKVDKLSKKIGLEENKELNKGNDAILGHGQEYKNESETTANPAQSKDKMHLTRVEPKATVTLVPREERRVQEVMKDQEILCPLISIIELLITLQKKL